MYFELIVFILFIFLVFLIILERNNYVLNPLHSYPMEDNENFEVNDDAFYKQPSLTEKLTYELQYKNLSLNKEKDKAFVFNEDAICKDNTSDGKNIFSLTRELTCKDMTDYLQTIKVSLNSSIPKDTLSNISSITVDKWDDKILLNDIEFRLTEGRLPKKQFAQYVNMSQKIKFINDFVNNSFIKILNDNFESSNYFDKYNKHHIFTPYKLNSYNINKYFIHKTPNENYQRGIITLKIHRPNKVHDFILLLDIFFIPKKNFKNIFKSEADFKNAYHFFINTVKVIGNPIRYTSKYLEEDDTNFVQNNFQILTEEMQSELQEINKILSYRDKSQIETKYYTLFDEIQVINQNKSFNSIVFKELLFKIKKIVYLRENLLEDEKGDVELRYEKLLETFIIHCQNLLNDRKTLKKDLDQDVKFSDEQLNGQKIFAKELIPLIKEVDANKDKSFSQLSGEKMATYYSKYRCYDPRYTDVVLDQYENEPSCISFHEDIGVNGVYDKKCEKNDDCPFFQANTNYPNDFGGCKEGLCEVPVGMNIIGGTKISRIGKPNCYNCEEVRDNKNTIFKEDGECCHLQYNDERFNSPDFIFKGDKQLRFKHRTFLEDKGLQP
jgi:hypothetical protein